MRTIRYKTAITEAMREEMERDERVFVIGEDVDVLGGVFKLTRGFVEQFGARRVRGTPISEAAFIGCAPGAAMTGLGRSWRSCTGTSPWWAWTSS